MFLISVFLWCSAGTSHPDEAQLHSSALTYDLYNPSVGIYHPGAENTHNLIQMFKHNGFTHFFSFPLSYYVVCFAGSTDQHDHEAVYIEPSSSSPGLGNNDYFEMEEEVGKRFYPMVPVPVSLLIP